MLSLLWMSRAKRGLKLALITSIEGVAVTSAGTATASEVAAKFSKSLTKRLWNSVLTFLRACFLAFLANEMILLARTLAFCSLTSSR